MLPFLKKRQQIGLIVQRRTPDVDKQEEESEEDHAVRAAASDLIDAITAKDVKATAEALLAAFQIMELYPHEEGEHIDLEEIEE